MSSTVVPVLESCQFIADKSRDVSINNKGVKEFAKKLLDLMDNGKPWTWEEHPLNPTSKDQSAVDWLFFVDTLNFSFWSEDSSKKYCVKYGGMEHTGYWSLCAAVNRALDEGIPLTDPKYYSKISLEELTHVFRSDSLCPMPMLEERLANLHQAGTTLVKKFGGTFFNCVKQCSQSAQKLLEIVLSNFPSFRDENEFMGRKVSLYKRAQILIGDIWACFHGDGIAAFDDIDTITMFADYRIPQALVYFGVLQYSDRLSDYLKTDHLMTSGDTWEVEIRGCSVWAVELVNREIQRLISSDPAKSHLQVNSIIIDHFLWDYRRAHDEETRDIPMHRIRCIYY